MASLLVAAIFLCISFAEAKYKIGVNYGQLANNLPSPAHAVALLQSMHIGHVKLYDANPAILQALAGTQITVAVMVTDAEVPAIAASQKVADLWVAHNVSAFFPATRIRTILVGNELLSDINQKQTWTQIVPAMQNLRQALIKQKLRHKIKISTPLAMDMLEGSAFFPPSNATFRENVRESVMRPLLKFLGKTRGALFVDVYPYLAWENDAGKIPLGLALFEGEYEDGGNGLRYGSLLDVQLDAVAAAMARLGFNKEEDDEVKVVVSETGWPTAQGWDERGANIHNAALYNRRLVQKMVAVPPHGTPRRPGTHIPTYIFALFNENEKPGPTTERNWGLLYPNGTRVYDVDLTGQMAEAAYPPLLPAPAEPPVGSQKFWCVANSSASSESLEAGLEYACAQDPSICAPLQADKPCFQPNTTLSHASFAFNAYYVLFKALGGSCVFGASAHLTTTDPSYGSCKYSPLVF
ncbi:hypothetical protein GOP47_0002831 [Adiantum capillus-veneris]|uniref:glucan endo-1,3-beta-D-glucosidase n=1 Tax=Adiantum capillus-veneris TaxID=13818 RepID=A0A9D4VCJ3_ADICA|nr:hypothetical protein GOP47_0002831 [Adiantum capillus-veneris]